MMNQVWRYTISGVIGLSITGLLFVGMLKLLGGSQPTINSTDTNINFDFVKAITAPETKPPKEREKPTEPKVVQPPATPTMPTTASDPIEGIGVPIPGINDTSPNILEGIGQPSLNPGSVATTGEGGTVKTGMAPMYPPREMMNKTEGWVKVLIHVNKFGQVSAAEVLAAKPARVFNTETLKALKKWQFYPKIIDGQAVPFQVTQTIEFSLDQ